MDQNSGTLKSHIHRRNGVTRRQLYSVFPASLVSREPFWHDEEETCSSSLTSVVAEREDYEHIVRRVAPYLNFWRRPKLLEWGWASSRPSTVRRPIHISSFYQSFQNALAICWSKICFAYIEDSNFQVPITGFYYWILNTNTMKGSRRAERETSRCPCAAARKSHGLWWTGCFFFLASLVAMSKRSFPEYTGVNIFFRQRAIDSRYCFGEYIS